MNFKLLNELVGVCRCMINMYINNEWNGYRSYDI